MKFSLFLVLFLRIGVLHAQNDSTEFVFETIFGGTSTFKADSIINMPVSDMSIVGKWKLEELKIKKGKLKGKLRSSDTLAVQICFHPDRSLEIITSQENTFGYWTYTEPESITFYGAAYGDSSMVLAQPVKLKLIELNKNKLIIETDYGRQNTRGKEIVFWFVYRKM